MIQALLDYLGLLRYRVAILLNHKLMILAFLILGKAFVLEDRIEAAQIDHISKLNISLFVCLEGLYEKFARF